MLNNMIRLYPTNGSSKNLVSITLVEGTPKAPFEKDSKFAPNKDGGFDIFVNTNDFKWYQIAARTIASLNIFSFSLKPFPLLTQEKLYWFMTALYDGIHEITVEFDYDESSLKSVEETVNLVSKFRALADSDSKQSTPVKVLNKLFEMINEEALKAKAKASLTLIKRGDKEFEEFAGLNAVGLASDEAPCMGIIDIIPNGVKENSDIDVALVGKGITFDTGGYSLKPEKFMETMRTDKTAVIYLSGAVCLALKRGLNKHVRLYLCCSENMVSGKGMLPGDVIKYKNDITVEINNTDAEGRLVLADGLIKACEDKAKFILDMATLTGAAKIAVGRDMFSVITSGNVLDNDFKNCLDTVDEMYWQLPLSPFHRRFLSSRRATVTNSGHGDGAPGSSVAASFLEQFVTARTPWIHIDLSSAYLPDGSPFLAAGPTGATMLGLSAWLCS